MNQKWSEFLNRQGAHRNDQGIAEHMGQSPSVDTDTLFACENWQILKLRGDDAEKFLQGQVTADVRDVTAGSSRTALHLSLKGRALASMRLVPANEGIDILVPTLMAETLHSLLEKYIVFSKATLEVDTSRVILGLAGKNASEQLAANDLLIPGPDDGCAQTNDITVINPGATRRYLLLLDCNQAMALWPGLAKGLNIGAAAYARLAEIQAGEAHVQPETSDHFLPQELNYDHIHGISFNKGCYTGQEVVARIKFKGKVKQRLNHFSWKQTEEIPTPGILLTNSSGKTQAEIACAQTCDHRVHALMVVREVAQELLLNKKPLEDLRQEPLPYLIES